MSYQTDVKTQLKFQSNVVILIGGTDYFSIHQPDSGLVVADPNDESVASLVLNPASIDIRRVTTNITTFSFRLLDADGVVSALVLGDAGNLIGKEVRVFLGRTGVAMDFANYYELPRTFIQKCEHGDNSYLFSSAEPTKKMDRAIYDFVAASGAAFASATTEFTMRDDISGFPTAGFLKIDEEFVSYTGIDIANNRFTGVIRGELNSIPTEHDINTDAVLVQTVTDNPLNIFLKIMTSGGGGSVYDVLQSGLAIDENLIDITDIEALRDSVFLGDSFTLSLYSIDSALKYIEEEILEPCGLRITNSANSKITLKVLNKAQFIAEDDIVNENTITKFPKWNLDGAKVTNVIEVQWDFNEGTGQYQKRSSFESSSSIAQYGKQPALKYEFRGIKELSEGQAFVDDFGSRLLARIARPTPEVQVNTQLDKSLQNVGDKAFVVSTKIPAADGTLNFSSLLEIISRSINLEKADVQFKMAFTSFTNIRSGFIAPSDNVVTVVSQKKITIASGRGARYQVGQYMRLWNNVGQVYFADAPNKIVDITGDSITFENNWTTVLVVTNHRMRFADYNDSVDSQKRYCYISDNGADFADGKQTYKVTY